MVRFGSTRRVSTRRLIFRVPTLAAFAVTLIALAFLGRADNVAADHIPVLPEVRVFSPTFSTSGQSMWGPGESAVPTSPTYPLFSESFGGSGGTGRHVVGFSSDIPGYEGSWEFGGEVNGYVDATVGASVGFSSDSGTVNVDYPVDVAISTPPADSFRAGDTISIGTSLALRPGASIDISPAGGSINLNGDYEVSGGVTAELCYWDECTNQNIVTPFDSGPVSAPLLPITTEIQVPITPLETLLHGISGYYGIPTVNTTSSVKPDGRTLVATGTDRFVDLALDIDTWIGRVASAGIGHFVPPLGIKSPEVNGIQFGYELIDFKFGLQVDQDQTFTFTPTVFVTLNFLPEIVSYTEYDETGAFVATGTSSSIKYEAGHSIDVVVPPNATGILDVEPVFTIENTFSNNTATTFIEELRFKALELTSTVPNVQIAPKVVITEEYEVCDPTGVLGCTTTPEVSVGPINTGSINVGTIGPVWQEIVPVASQTDNDLFDDDRAPWTLEDFNTVTGIPLLEVNPQFAPDAVISAPETAAEGDLVTFDATNSSDADDDPLSFIWDFGDGTRAIGPIVDHTYADNDIYTVTLTAKDGHLVDGIDIWDIEITNVAPSVSAGSNKTAFEGSQVTLGPDLFGKNLIENGDAENGISGWPVSPSSLVAQNYAPLSEPMLSELGLFNDNALTNPGAENGLTGWNSFLMGTPAYAASGGVSPSDPGPVNDTGNDIRGTNYFRGIGNGITWLRQSVSPPAAIVDEGDLTYNLTGWIGVKPGTIDAIGVGLRANGNSVPGGFSKQGGSNTGLQFRDGGSHALPVGSRTLKLEMWQNDVYTGAVGNDGIDAYADEFSLEFGLPNSYALDGVTASGYPRLDSDGPSERGNSFFRGGTSGLTTAYQYFDVSEVMSLIQAGAVDFELSGYLGGFGGQEDSARLGVVFQSTSGQDIRWIGPVTAANRGGQSSLLFRSLDGGVPPETEQIGIVLEMARAKGTRNDGYADNLSLILRGQASANVTDPGTSDTHTSTVDWGDNSPIESGLLNQEAGSAAVLASHAYAENGTYTVTVTVTDDDGASTDDSFDVTVLNAPPVVTGSDRVMILDRNTTRVFATFTDPGSLDTFTATVDWGDGAVTPATLSGNQVSGTHTYSGLAGPFPFELPVIVTVLDDDGGVGVAAPLAIVSDLEIPSITVSGPSAPIAEGSVAVFSGSFDEIIDPSTGQPRPGVTYTAEWDFGDGTNAPAVVVAPGTLSASHVYTDDGTFVTTMTIRASDSVGPITADDASAAVTVINLAPSVSAGLDAVASEGEIVAVGPIVITDAGANDTHTGVVSWGDGTIGSLGTGATSHVYADNGEYTVTVTVTDDDGLSGNDSLTVTVNNAAPAVNAGPDQTVLEGQLVLLAPATFNDAGTADTHTATVNWGDGSAIESGVVTQSPTGPPGSTSGLDGVVSGSHVYADNGTYTVTVTVTDDDGLSGNDSLTVTVNNAAPAVNAGPDQAVLEGQLVSLAPATFNDAGTLDSHTATVNWGDGSAIESGVVTQSPTGPPGSTSGLDGVVSGAHVYADNGTYTVTVTVTDDDGLSGNNSLTVTVNNAAPVLIAGPDQTVLEGQLVSLAPAAFNDAGTSDTHTATVNWGDGSAIESGAVTQSPTGPPGSTSGVDGVISGSHVYADNGTYIVAVTLTDDDGLSGNDSLSVTVNNAAPVVIAGPNQTVLEGQLVSLAPATFNDAGTLDSHTATVNWGDGSPIESGVVTQSPTGPPGSTSGVDGVVSGSHVYADNGTYTVTVTLTDDDGLSGNDSLTVTVNNAAPAVIAGPDQTVLEGQLVSLAPATFSDAGTSDTHTATVNWGDGSIAVKGSASVVESSPGLNGTASETHVYVDDGTYTVIVTVEDDDGAEDEDTFVVTVVNAAPIVDAGPDRTALYLDPFMAWFTDAGTSDTHTAVIEWIPGDISPGIIDQVAGTISDVNGNQSVGQFTVTVTVTDDDGGVGSDSVVIDVRGSRSLIQRAHDNLEMHVAEEKHIGHAVKALAKAVEDDLWIDEIHAATKHGKKVFDHASKGVLEIQKALDTRPSARHDNLDPLTREWVEIALHDILIATELLAQFRLAETADLIALDPEKQDEVDKANARAAKEFGKALNELDEEDYRNAIRQFGRAWKHAEKAAEQAAKRP